MYREHDYAFANRLLALRTRAALTQQALAAQLGVHRRSVQNWESGSAYPKPDVLQRLIGILLAHGAFTSDSAAAEAEAVWELAAAGGTRSLPPFDAAWFAASVARQTAQDPDRGSAAREYDRDVPGSSPSGPPPLVDWGEALAVPYLEGRDVEQAALTQWLVTDRCRVVAVLGMGGIGKSSLALTVGHALRPQFDVVLFRSLQNAPPLADMLNQALGAISAHAVRPQESSAELLAQLVQLLRERRCLMILDNFEALLEPATLAGTYRPGYGDYAQLLRVLGEREHGSCLLLTSREKPAELGALEGRSAPVRTLALGGLDAAACQRILATRDLIVPPEQVAALTRMCGGNPLALQLVAEPLRELFGGDVAAFLAADADLFPGIAVLLQQQWSRSTPLEQSILRWMAIKREHVSVADLLAVAGDAGGARLVLAALESLRRRMLIERSAERPGFMLQPVILEYVTDQLVQSVALECAEQRPALLRTHPLVEATAKTYVRRAQERLIAEPLLQRLHTDLDGADVVEHLAVLLKAWRDQDHDQQGYGPGNIMNLIRLSWGQLRGIDGSQLLIRQAVFQGVELQDASLAGATLQDSVFTGAFDATPAVAVSSQGTYWAAGSRRGDVQLWRDEGRQLAHSWRAHADYIPQAALAFTPDERFLATSAQDGIVKLWDVATGALVWAAPHAGLTYHLAITPDGRILATAANGPTTAIVFWDLTQRSQILTLPHPRPITALRWHPDGLTFASGDVAGELQLWQVRDGLPTTIAHRLAGHTAAVVRLAFAPVARKLASASWDGTVAVWDLERGQLEQRLTGHQERVTNVSWSPTGRLIASSSRDQTIRLWDIAGGSPPRILHGHHAEVWSLAFTPDGRTLLSGSDDGTIRVWDVATGACTRVMEGHAVALRDFDWSPDGAQLVSGGAGTPLTVWDRHTGVPARTLDSPSTTVAAVRWQPGGHQIVTSEWNSRLTVWDATTGVQRAVRPADPAVNFFYDVAWHPDGQHLASGSFRHGVHVIDARTGSVREVGAPLATFFRRVAWSPDGTRLAAGGDASVYIFDGVTGRLAHQLSGHHTAISALAWSPDGTHVGAADGRENGNVAVWHVAARTPRVTLAHPGVVYGIVWLADGSQLVTAGSDGRIRWWDLAAGHCQRTVEAHVGTVHALRLSPDGAWLASCGDDGAIRIWDAPTGELNQTLRRDRPYERLDIRGVRGLSAAQITTLQALGAVGPAAASE